MSSTVSHSSYIRYMNPRKVDQRDCSEYRQFLPPIFEQQRSHRHQRLQDRNRRFERIDSKRRSFSQSSDRFEISYKIHDGFTVDEEILIENALQIVSNRLFKAEVLENMYRICGTAGYFLAPGLWKRSNLSKHSANHGKEFLLRYQLMCLKTKGKIGQFPTIHIHPIDQKSEIMARGIFACVSCISHQSTFTIEGEFQVKLNQYHLNASTDNGLDAIDWAGIIVHEMLHNLGHNHDHHDYTDRWQMNIFKECFIHNGKYSP